MNNVSSDWTPAVAQQPARAVEQSESAIDLRELFGLLWYRKWIIALIAAVVTALSIFYVVNATKLYEARSTLIVEEEQQNAAGLEAVFGGLSDEDSELNSQIEVIRSREVIGKVVDTLLLDQDPEFVRELRSGTWYQEPLRAIKRSISSFMSISEGEGDGSGGFGKQTHRELAIDSLISKLGVSVIRNTHVFLLRLETTSPQKSANIINTVSAAFIENEVAGRNIRTEKAAKWLTEKVATLGGDLANAEAAAAEYRSKTERNVTEADVAASNNALKIARGRLNSFERNLPSENGLLTPRSDRELSRYATLKDDVTQLETILAKQTEDLLELRQLDREATAAGAIYEHFVTRLNEIEVQQGLQNSDVRVLSKAIPRFEPTKPRTLMTVAFGGLFGLFLGMAFVITRRIMDHSFSDAADLYARFGIPVVGTIPKAPSRNRRGLLNYAKAKSSSALMESIRDLRTTIMATKVRRKTDVGAEAETMGNVLTLASSARTEGIATNDDVEKPEARGKVIALSSSVPAEGKTTSAVLLAVNTAALNKKVLLIECDLRKSTFTEYFGRKVKYGLQDMLNDNVAMQEGVWTEENTGIDVIFGNIMPRNTRPRFFFWRKRASKGKNAGDVFASPEFARFIETTRAHYDLVILDCPPVLPVPDARLIAKQSDYLLYSVHAGDTPSSTVAAGLRQFETIGVTVDGLNLTQMSKREAYYGNYGYGDER